MTKIANCPRCGLPMRVEKHKGIEIDGCPECWGYWLDKGEFAALTTKGLAFSDQERDQVRSWAAASTKKKGAPSGRLDALVKCPRCDKTMDRVHINLEAPITLDRCEAHGLWFDTRELKLAQVLATDAAQLRDLLFEKLKEK